MGGRPPNPLGHLLALGAAEVGATMSDRIEEIRTQQKERMTKASYTDLFVRGAYLSDAEAALTEALDIARIFRKQLTEQEQRTLRLLNGERVLLDRLAEQERLLERTEQRLRGMHTGWLDSQSCQCSRGAPCIVAIILSDLDARSVPTRSVEVTPLGELDPILEDGDFNQ